MKRRKLSLVTKHSIYGYIFASPFIIGFVLFFLSPVVLFVIMGFSDISFSNSGMLIKYAGIEWFKFFLTENTTYITEVGNSLYSLLFSMPAIVIYSFFIATVLNQKFKGRSFFRAMFFLPVLIASGAAVLLQANSSSMYQALNAVKGVSDTKDVINISSFIIQMIGPAYMNIITQYISPLVDNISFIITSSGVQILIFLAALQTVPPSLYEAAQIDGSTAWESFWKITFPYLTPMILVNSVYTIIDLLGGNSNIVINDIFTQLTDLKYSLGASMFTLYFVVIFALLGLFIFFMSKLVYYEDK